MGRKGKKQDDYWESGFEQDAEATDNGEAPKTEEPVKQDVDNNNKKKGAASNNKKTATKDEPENDAPKNQGGKKNRKKKGNEELTEEELEKLMLDDAEPVKKEAQPPKKQSQPAPKKETTAATKEEDGEAESTNEASSSASSATPATTGGKKKAAAKEDPKKKKGGISKKVAEALKKRQEEEEQRRKEEEEQRLKEEEEDRIRAEEEARLEAIRQERKEKKKLKEKEKKVKAEQKAKEERLAMLRQQFQGQVSAAQQSSDGTTTSDDQQQQQVHKPKRVIYGNVKKKKNQQNKDESAANAATAEKPVETPETKPAESAPEPAAAQEEVVDDWETRDSWEDAVNEEKPLSPAAPIVTPTPAATSTATTTAAAAAKTEVKPVANNNNNNAAKPNGASPVPATVKSQPSKNANNNNNTNKKKDKEEEEAGEEEESLRSPICCVLGHVDTGKTKLLDKIRRTNVQEGEAGGITQQIGATWFPMESLREMTSRIKNADHLSVKVPGLLIIDTPGHESFTNLRSRGSSLCDIAILVVDITAQKLEQQTLESINLLKMRKTPFVIALNKVDRMYGWEKCLNSPIQDALKKQPASAVAEFEDKVKNVQTFMAEQGLNATLYYKNKDFRKFVSIVPTSAHSGEGIPDLLMLLVQLTQRLMMERLLLLSKLQCTVLEVKVVEGFGTTIDVILVNGVLHEGDTIVLCGLNGPIVTTIRALLTPQPLREMRVRGQYVHHKTIHAAMGIKISAPELDKAVAGSSLLVAHPGDDIEDLKREVMKDLDNLRSRIKTTDIGVYVQASTLGSLEALLEFLRESKIPVSGINIGPISKKDVIKAAVMLERAKEYAVILAFDVKLPKDVAEVAEDMGVRIFTAEIIYHLFDQFTAYMDNLNKKKQEAAAPVAVFPCRLKIFPEYIFNKKEPIVLGVEVTDGTLRMGTPICVPTKEFCYLGRVTGIEINHKQVQSAKQSSQVALKIENEDPNAQQKVYGRHFDHEDELVSQISRESIDALKANFKKDISKEDVQLLARLKTVFGIK